MESSNHTEERKSPSHGMKRSLCCDEIASQISHKVRRLESKVERISSSEKAKCDEEFGKIQELEKKVKDLAESCQTKERTEVEKLTASNEGFGTVLGFLMKQIERDGEVKQFLANNAEEAGDKLKELQKEYDDLSKELENICEKAEDEANKWASEKASLEQKYIVKRNEEIMAFEIAETTLRSKIRSLEVEIEALRKEQLNSDVKINSLMGENFELANQYELENEHIFNKMNQELADLKREMDEKISKLEAERHEVSKETSDMISKPIFVRKENNIYKETIGLLEVKKKILVQGIDAQNSAEVENCKDCFQIDGTTDENQELDTNFDKMEFDDEVELDRELTEKSDAMQVGKEGLRKHSNQTDINICLQNEDIILGLLKDHVETILDKMVIYDSNMETKTEEVIIAHGDSKQKCSFEKENQRLRQELSDALMSNQIKEKLNQELKYSIAQLTSRVFQELNESLDENEFMRKKSGLAINVLKDNFETLMEVNSSKIKRVMREVKEMSEEIVSKNTKIHDLRKEISVLKETNDSSEDMRCSRITDFTIKLKEKTEKIVSKDATIQNLETKFKEKTKRHEKLIVDSNRMIKNLKKKLAETKNSLEQKVNNLERRNTTDKALIEHMYTQARKRDEEIKDLKKQQFVQKPLQISTNFSRNDGKRYTESSHSGSNFQNRFNNTDTDLRNSMGNSRNVVFGDRPNHQRKFKNIRFNGKSQKFK